MIPRPSGNHRGGSWTVGLNGVIIYSRYLPYLEMFRATTTKEGVAGRGGWRPGVLGNIPQQLP